MWIFVFQMILVLSVCAEDFNNNYVDEIDPVVEFVLNTDQYVDTYDEDDNNIMGEILNLEEHDNYRIWTCGDCADINNANAIYDETYNFESQGYGNSEIDIQMGLSLEAMRCITVRTERKGQVFRLAGTCLSEAILRVLDTKLCDISVYE